MQALQMMVEKLLLLRDIQKLCCLEGDQSDPSLLLFRRVSPSDGLREGPVIDDHKNVGSEDCGMGRLAAIQQCAGWWPCSSENDPSPADAEG